MSLFEVKCNNLIGIQKSIYTYIVSTLKKFFFFFFFYLRKRKKLLEDAFLPQNANINKKKKEKKN
jgi:hypothetical protein